MKNKFFALFLVFSVFITRLSIAAIGDTIVVNSFSNAIHQNCNTVIQSFLFPSDTNHYQKIMLNYKLSCPSGIGCDPYDRIGQLKAFKKTGIYDSTNTEILEPFEIMRMITPYGMGVGLWVDVSDYRSLFNDSVQLSSSICGYANGWAVTADFYFIKGRPIREAYKIENLWTGTFQYGNASDPIDNHLQAITKNIDSAAFSTKIRLVTTGHGFNCDPDPNVAEFSDLTHTLIVNGNNLQQHLWRDDCGINPLYPQPMSGTAISTWYYNRANWCPGTWVRPHDYDITGIAPAGTNAIVDYDMLPYTNTGGASCSYAPEYWIQSQIIYYKLPSYTNNLELVAICKPNSAFDYRRVNPICTGNNPEIIIRNNGSAVLNSVVFQISMDGLPLNNFTWNGNLAFMDTTRVALPAINIAAGAHTFDVLAVSPNGQLDEYTYDNHQFSNFNSTNVYTNNVVRLFVRTDNTGSESSCELRDASGNLLFSHGPYSGNNVLYRDTFYLPNGCYSFTMFDSYGDGMCCFNGSGFFRLSLGLTGNANIVNTGDFGASKTVNFTINAPNAISNLQAENEFSVFPNPSNGVFTINFWENSSKNLTLEVFDVFGKKIMDKKVTDLANNFLSVDWSQFTNGVYMLLLVNDTSKRSKRIIIRK